MNGMKSTINLKSYITELVTNGKFIIPDYQRGYIWGQRNKDDKNKTDSVTYIMDTLIKGYIKDKEESKSHNNKGYDIFLQGITFHKDGDDIVIIDGQQRTTFFYLLLTWLNFDGHFEIMYRIREKSNKFLNNKQNILTYTNKNDKEKFQDIYFFKKTLRIIERKKDEIGDKSAFLEYILEHVRFLRVEISKENAEQIFSMMNGNKAQMRDEELIKSELLRCASLKIDEIQEPENAMIRNRLARDWDKWLYWWNRKDVKELFRARDRMLGWLLPLSLKKSVVTFTDFYYDLLKDKSVSEAKQLFKKLRLRQLSIEDAYNNPITYNYMIATLCILANMNEEVRYSFLNWYFDYAEKHNNDENIDVLKKYFYLSLIGVEHKHIDAMSEENIKDAFRIFKEKLASNDLYNDPSSYNAGRAWLLRCNVEKDNELGRKFDFSIWKECSLEHIYPKSNVWHEDKDRNKFINGARSKEHETKSDVEKEYVEKNKTFLWQETIYYKDENGIPYKATEHSIGNLVLLYKNDNSKLGNLDFEEKKTKFFKLQEGNREMKSRHLTHSILVFAKSTWDGEQIARHKKDIINEFNNVYKKYGITE